MGIGLNVLEGEFTEDEKKILEQFASNTERNVFALMNLPEVIKGALFSRYSRSMKSLRRLLLDEFINSAEINFKDFAGQEQGAELKAAVQKAQGFYDRILDGYGDDSVGELGGAHIACEYISNVAAKFIEDSRIGGSPLEKSTRYVWFNNKVNGEYLFYKEPRIMKSSHANTYLAVNRLLFDTYSRLIEPMTKYVVDNFPLDEFEFLDQPSKASIMFKDIADEKLRKRASAAYNSSVKAKACDALRGLLPASTLTNVGIFGNGRFFQGLLTKMYSSSLTEINILAGSMHNELNAAIPSFVKRAKRNEYLETVNQNMRSLTEGILKEDKPEITGAVSLEHYDKETETEMIAAMLYPHSRMPMRQIKQKIRGMSLAEMKKIIDTYVSKRRNRRDKPGRALEHTYYTFDMLTDFGIYRDLQRHRMMTQQRQALTTIHGYVTPEEIEKAGLREEYDYCMQEAEKAYNQLCGEFPSESQYIVPMAFKVRWYAKLNLREAFHLIELRSTPQGHPGYRRIAQEMYRKIESVHPALAYYMKFVDMNDYPLGRIGSELRKEEKRELLSG
ncbi:FAD-dependent thymidylate synthase [Candidatus Woesearchaeota archaeon]|nr:FAD-dependent thymidylate synthase [Candidatus Woesearchaeota archaeon]